MYSLHLLLNTPCQSKQGKCNIHNDYITFCDAFISYNVCKIIKTFDLKNKELAAYQPNGPLVKIEVNGPTYFS